MKDRPIRHVYGAEPLLKACNCLVIQEMRREFLLNLGYHLFITPWQSKVGVELAKKYRGFGWVKVTNEEHQFGEFGRAIEHFPVQEVYGRSVHD